MTEPDQPWSKRIALTDIPEQGLHVAIEADAEARATLARTAGLRDLPKLEASFDLRRTAVGLHVMGEVVAAVGQNCVVSLEPVDKNLHEVVDLMFAPGPSETQGTEDGEVSIGMTEAEAAEPLVGGVVDLGTIATEYFLLGIDPYPRKDGAVFEASIKQDAPESPFAALAGLKKPPLGSK